MNEMPNPFNSPEDPMEDTIIAVYCLCDEFLKAYGYMDDPQSKMSTAETITTAVVAATYYRGNVEIARLYMKNHRYVSRMLSKSRLNRRLHAIPEEVWLSLFAILGEAFKAMNETQEYIVDSLPIPVCDNIRIRRCRIYRNEAFRGWIASKRRYFYGIRIHLIVTATGQPVEFALAPGAESDLPVFRSLPLDLPERATICADKLYNDYLFEDVLLEEEIFFRPLRKKNSKRPREPWETYLLQHARKRVETTFSQIVALFPKSIHAVTARGFELKVFCFLLSFSFLSLGC